MEKNLEGACVLRLEPPYTGLVLYSSELFIGEKQTSYLSNLLQLSFYSMQSNALITERDLEKFWVEYICNQFSAGHDC